MSLPRTLSLSLLLLYVCGKHKQARGFTIHLFLKMRKNHRSINITCHCLADIILKFKDREKEKFNKNKREGGRKNSRSPNVSSS